MKKHLIAILIFITFLFFSCGNNDTPNQPQQTSMNLTIKNGPALVGGNQYTMIIGIGGKQYSSTITGNSFNATINDVPQGYQEIVVNIYELNSLIAQGYSQLYISPGYNNCIIDFKSPQITHNPPASVMYDASLTISCAVTDDANTSNITAILYYSSNGSTFQNTTMTKMLTEYSAIIPNTYTRGDTVYYYIKASDPYRSIYFGAAGNVASSVNPIQVFVVPNQAPVVSHTAISSETQGIAINISAQITDDSGVQTATLFYKTSTGNYQSAAMTNTTANTFTAQIPGASVETPYIYYYIRAYDGYTYSFFGNAGYTLTDPAANPIPVTVYQTPDITPPVITHTAITSTNDSYLITINAVVSDDSYVQYVYIKYKKYNDASFQTAVMNNTSGNNWSGFISFMTPNTDTTYYYIEAYDGRNYSYYGISGQILTNPHNNVIQISFIDIATLADITAPSIIHTKLNSGYNDSPLSISAIISDNIQVTNAFVYYRINGSNIYNSIVMNKISGNNYSAEIPSNYITYDGIQYYIKATDSSNNSSYYGDNGLTNIEPISTPISTIIIPSNYFDMQRYFVISNSDSGFITYSDTPLGKNKGTVKFQHKNSIYNYYSFGYYNNYYKIINDTSGFKITSVNQLYPSTVFADSLVYSGYSKSGNLYNINNQLISYTTICHGIENISAGFFSGNALKFQINCSNDTGSFTEYWWLAENIGLIKSTNNSSNINQFIFNNCIAVSAKINSLYYEIDTSTLSIGAINGTIYDNNTGLPIAGAIVQLANTLLGDVTDSDGDYIIENIPPGNYDIIIKVNNYVVGIKNNITINKGYNTSLNQ